MNPKTEARLARLEAAAPAGATGVAAKWNACTRAVLAASVWREGESPADALARALGVATAAEALYEPKHWKDIDARANRLWEVIGVSDDDIDNADVDDGVQIIIEGINKKLAETPKEVRDFFKSPEQY